MHEPTIQHPRMLAPEWASETDESRLYYLTKAMSTSDDEWECGIHIRGVKIASTGFDEVYGGCTYEEVEPGKPSASGFELADIDLFLVGLNREEALAKIEHVHGVLKQAWGGTENDIFAVRTNASVTFVSSWPRRRVQIILRLYQSVCVGRYRFKDKQSSACLYSTTDT